MEGKRKAVKSLRIFNTDDARVEHPDPLPTAKPEEVTMNGFPLSIELKPFRNKVGGHTAIFKFSERAVCKELNNNEDKVYELIEETHKPLLEFVPKYIGVLNVRYSTQGDNVDDIKVLFEDNKHIIPKLVAEGPPEPADRVGGLTRINTKFQTEVFSEMLDNKQNFAINLDLCEAVESFILLEDLTWDLQKPCIIDLKMGTRQYGIQCAAIKRKSQQVKCRDTTSRNLGVRICGLQCYNVGTDKFTIYDKYYGRRVQQGTDFALQLVKFLDNAGHIYDILIKIPQILSRLKKIHQLFCELKAFYRLYGSSILIMYDGLSNSTIKVKIIDFAKTVITKDPETVKNTAQTQPGSHFLPHMDTPKDYGYLKGIVSLIHYFQTIFEKLSCIAIGDHNETQLLQKIQENKHQYMTTFNEAMLSHVSFTGTYDYEDYVSD